MITTYKLMLVKMLAVLTQVKMIVQYYVKKHWGNKRYYITNSEISPPLNYLLNKGSLSGQEFDEFVKLSSIISDDKVSWVQVLDPTL